MTQKLVDGNLVDLTPEEEEDYQYRIANPPASAPRQFTRLQILEALYAIKGDAFVEAALDDMQANSRKAYERWVAAVRIDEDDPDFLAQLNAMGITLTQLETEIDSP